MVTTHEEEKAIRRAAAALHDVVWELSHMIEDAMDRGNDIDASEVDSRAEKLMRGMGARPALKHYRPPWSPRPYLHTICLSLNDEIVHATPDSGKMIRKGDVVKIDTVLELDGWYADMAITMFNDQPPYDGDKSAKWQLIRDTRDIATGVIEAIGPGWTTKNIANWIHKAAKSKGLRVCDRLTGHAIGREIHMGPIVYNEVPKLQPIRVGYPSPPFRGEPLKPGMVLCIEPMLTNGSGAVVDSADGGWAVKTADGATAAHWEHMALITEDGRAEFLTSHVG